MTRIGIECESTEGNAYGVGANVSNLLKEISANPELKKEFKFFLYYKGAIPSFSLYYYIVLPFRVWRDKIDIMFFPNYMLPFGIFSKSIVVLTNDLFHEIKSSHQSLINRLAYKLFCTNAVKNATVIMTLSQASKDDMVNLFGVDGNKIVINHLGVDAPKITKPNNKNGVYILYVGQMLARRHAKETILAFNLLKDEFPDVKLIMVGADKYRPKIIKEMTSKNDRITYIERATDDQLSSLYANAKAMVYVSDIEAFGLPPLEALTYGTVPIVADSPVGHELLGSHAVYCKPTISGISNAFRKVLTSDSPRKPVQLFLWSDYVDRFIKICKKIA